MTDATLARRESLNLRIRPELRSLIDQGAEALGKNRTDFILDAARRAAEEALLDRALLTVGPEAHAAFLERLDQPPRPNARLRRILATVPPWETT